MAWLIAAVCAAAAFAMWRKAAGIRKDAARYAARVGENLERLISGERIIAEEETEDTLWGRTGVQLAKAERILRRRAEEAGEEKRQIEELISNISHQIRTPAANLKICLELLEGELSEAERRHFLSLAEKHLDRLDFLLQSLVKMSRLETGVIRIHSVTSDLRTALSGAVAAVVPKAEKKNIRLSVRCGSVFLRHDRKWTEEAVFNLLDNAVKYTGENGFVSVDVKVQEIFTKISVRDTGKGIAKERQAAIFTRFYREPEVCGEEGIGIGLYLARKIVEMQKGWLEVRSEPGKGSEFLIFLPNDPPKMS